MSPKGLFKIRGHHLDQFAWIVQSGNSPEWHAATLARDIIDHGDESDYPDYKIDVLGATATSELQTMLRFAQVFKEFVELDDYDPIQVIGGGMDVLCNSCTIGHHCNRLTQKFELHDKRDAPYILEHSLHDHNHVSKFLKLCSQLGNMSGVEFSPEKFDSQRARILVTEDERKCLHPPLTAPAGYVKAVLQQWDLKQGA
jgi:hypothetical protein